MFRKLLIILIMAPLLIGAINTGTSFPVLLLMISLLLIALAEAPQHATSRKNKRGKETEMEEVNPFRVNHSAQKTPQESHPSKGRCCGCLLLYTRKFITSSFIDIE